MILKNWKTSAGGAAIILTALGKLISEISNGTPVDFNTLAVSIMTGLGLLLSKDYNVTGTQK